MGGPEHGVDGWSLETYDRDEITGLGAFTYERVRAGDDGVKTLETASAVREQPSTPRHIGWKNRVK